MKKFSLLFLLLSSVFYAPTLTADWTEYTVSNNNESGAGSLAQAITDLNANSADANVKVVFSGDTAITLTSHSLPTITRPGNTYILGEDTGGTGHTVSISGADTYQIVTIDGTANDAATNVIFGHLTITNGKSLGGNGGDSQFGGTGGGGAGIGGGILAKRGVSSAVTVSLAGYGANGGALVTACNATGGDGGTITATGEFGGGGGGSILGANGGNGSDDGSHDAGGGGGGASVTQYAYVANAGSNAAVLAGGAGGATGGGTGGNGTNPGPNGSGGSSGTADWYAAGGGGGAAYYSSISRGGDGGAGSSNKYSAGGGGGGGGSGGSDSGTATGANGGTGSFGAGGGGGGSGWSNTGTPVAGTGGSSTSYAGVTYGGAGGNGSAPGDAGQGGGGAGLGGGVFGLGGVIVQATTAVSPLTSNTVTAGTGANNGQAKGKDVFIKSGEFDLTFNSAYAADLDVYVLEATTSGGGLVLSPGSSDYTYSGVLSGVVDGIKKAGTGKLTLSGANTITTLATTSSGYFYIDQGTVALDTDGAIVDTLTVRLNADATAGFDISNKTLDTTIGNLISGAGSTVTLGTKKLTFGNASSTAIAGVIGGATAGSIDKVGAGTATLSAVNTYTGTTTISAGTLALDATGTIADSSLVTGTAGTLSLAASKSIKDLAGTIGVTLGANTLTVTAGASSFGGNISGTGGFTKEGAGNSTFTAANSYTGTTTISNGGLVLTGSGALSSSTLVTGTSSGVFDMSDPGLSGTARTIGDLSGEISVDLRANTLTIGNGSSTFSGGITGVSGCLTKSGTGTTTLTTNQQIYFGTTTISQGTLELSGSGDLINTSRISIADAATFKFTLTGNKTFTGHPVTLGGTSIIDVGGSGDYYADINAAIDGDALTKTGTCTLTLSAANTYTGTTTISAGTLNLSTTGISSTTSRVVMSDATTLRFTLGADSTFAHPMTLGGTSTIDVTGTDHAVDISGVISGTALTKTGTRKLTLSAANDYTGTTTISAGTLALSGSGALSDTTLVTGSGTFTIDGAAGNRNIGDLAGTVAVTLGTRSLTLKHGASSFGGVISGTGGFTKEDTGTTTFTAANTYSGITRVSAGTLELSGSGDLTNTIAIVVEDAATLKFTLTGNRTFAHPMTLGGTSTINVGGSDDYYTELSQIIDGDALTKTGTCTLILSNAANTYNGTTTISAGTLRVTNTAALAAGSGAVVDNAALEFNLALSGAFSGDINGTGTLTKTGAGTILTLSGNNDYTGTTTISAGTLRVTNTAALAASSGAVVDNDILNFNLTASGTFSGDISGTGTLTKTVAGTTLALSGTNSYSGGTTITAGTLLGNTNSLQGAIDNGDALIFSQAANGTYAGVMTGAGTLTKSGTGKVTLSGTSAAYTGATTVSGGTLNVSGSIAGSAVTVDSGTTLQGTGTVGPVVNNGTCAPGASIGTLHVVGDYTQGANSTLEVEIDNTPNSDLLIVSGTAALNNALNTTLQIIPQSGLFYNDNDVYTIIQAGNITGTFTNVTCTLPNMGFDVLYTPTLVQLRLQLMFTGLIAPGNPTIMGDYFRAIDIPSGSDLYLMFIQLAQLGPEQLDEALNQLHHGFFNTLFSLNYNNQKDIIQSYVSQVQDVYTTRMENQCFYAHNQNKNHNDTRIWFRPIFYLKDQETIGNYHEYRGYWGTSEGFALGGDHFWENFGFGVGTGYTYDTLRWSYPGIAKAHRKDAKLNTFFLGSYLGAFGKHWFLDASLSGSINTYSTRRRIYFGDIYRVARGYHSGWGYFGHLGVGLNLSRTRTDNNLEQDTSDVCFQPFVEIDSYNTYEKPFLESHAESLRLDVSKKNSSMIQTLTALRILKSFEVAEFCLQPKITVGWIFETPITSEWYKAKFVDQPVSFEVKSYHKNRNQAMIAFDLLAKSIHDTRPVVSVHYEADIEKKYLGQHISFKVEKSF